MDTANKNSFYALLTGAAIGGVLGVLFAPDRGSKTREKIKAKTLETTHDLGEKMKQAREDLAKATAEKKVEFEHKMEEVVELADT